MCHIYLQSKLLEKNVSLIYLQCKVLKKNVSLIYLLFKVLEKVNKVKGQNHQLRNLCIIKGQKI